MGFKVVRQGDPGFTVSDGILAGNRACMEIARDCPDIARNLIQQAYSQGWIKLSATFTEEEYTWLMLKQ
jgi:hypothetical protein